MTKSGGSERRGSHLWICADADYVNHCSNRHPVLFLPASLDALSGYCRRAVPEINDFRHGSSACGTERGVAQPKQAFAQKLSKLSE